ncbi:MAG: hypothetical protein QF600_07870 [Verrucomicrobiota bacterium]|nr:hypothetical protein [Verrucomicrobiota bacterium]
MKQLTLAVVFFLVLFSVAHAQEDTPVKPGESGISNDQRSVNDLLGAPLVNSRDSSIATENAKFSEETAYSKQQNQLAGQKSRDLGLSQNAEDAKSVIREVLGLDASETVKTDFRKASLLRLATHSEQKKAYEEAQKYLSEYLRKYPDDALIPVVLLRQGDLFRKMGAYDLERQKYYDVIKSAPKVKLEGKYDLNYVKRITYIARSQIADSFYEEASKLPRYRARGKYVSASEMYSRLLEAEGANKRVITLKYIRALYKQGDHSGVVKEGARYFAKFKDGPATDEDEMRYLVLDSSRHGSGDTHDYLAGYQDWFDSPPGRGTKNALKWRLKAAGDLAEELFNEGKYTDSLEFYQALAGLLLGSATRPEEYFYLMLGIKRILNTVEALEVDSAPDSEIFNAIEPMLLKIKERAQSSSVQIPLINAVLSGSGKGRFKSAKSGLLTSQLGLPLIKGLAVKLLNSGTGNYDTYTVSSGAWSPVEPLVTPAQEFVVTIPDGSSGTSEWGLLKPALVKTLNELKADCEARYTAILPILYRMALCSEKISGQSGLGIYEKIRVGVVDVQAKPDVVLDDAEFSNQEAKLHIVSKQTDGKDPKGVLVCVWHGVPAAGMELIRKEGGGSVKIIDFVGLANLGDGTNLHEKSLPLKLLSDMAAWRISTLKWEESFKKQVAEIAD